MRRFIYVLLALSVVLVGLSFAQNSEEGGESPSEGTWTVDLTEAGFGVVMFEPPENPANWGGLFVYASSVDSDGVCHVWYDPEADPTKGFAEQPEMANTVGFVAGDYRSFYGAALFACANGGREPQVVGDSDYRYQVNWILQYFEQCGGQSFYRLGWPGEPETTTDLACVPHFDEFMAGYETEP